VYITNIEIVTICAESCVITISHR